MAARNDISVRRKTLKNFRYSLGKTTGIGGIEAPSAASLNFGTGDFSVAAWVRFGSAPTSGVVIGKTANNFTNGLQGWSISRATSPNDFLFEVQDGVTRNFTSFNLGADSTWHLLCATRSGTTAKVYVDGVMTNSETEATYAGDVDNAANFVLFNDDSDSTSFFGSISHCLAWEGAALSDAEIEDLYFDGIISQEASLAVEFTMEEGTGTTLTDETGNANNGTFAGVVPTWSTNTP